jgi:hypothetical protein
MPVSIDIDDEQVQRSLRRYRENLMESASLMRRLSFNLRDYVRETMQMQGRKRPWAPLAQFTMLRTGRRKPLTTLVRHIKSEYTPTTLRVFFENPKGEDWTIEQHHKGFIIPPRVGRQGFYTARAHTPMFFMTSRGAKVPAREIIPTRREVDSVISAAVTDWVNARR